MKEHIPYQNPSLPVDRRVADLLVRMTLEEKLAQMTVGRWDAKTWLDEHGNFVSEKARADLKHGVGELGVIFLRMSARNGAKLANTIQEFLRNETRLGIPALFVGEALHGLMAQQATSFPQAIALASTWDPTLVEQVFQAAALEMRARGGGHALSPVLDLARDPRWGRTEETYGEDPHLVSRMGVAAVRGLQGAGEPIDQRHVLATTKHFAVHGQPEAGTNAAPANYAERDIREYFLAPFQAAISEGKAGCVMASYNEINGIPTHINPWLLINILREEWGFKGFVTSDGNAITQLEEIHHVATSKTEAARKALEAGIDFELDHCFHTLLEQVRGGKVHEARIDEAVGRILRAKFLLGLFEDPFVDVDFAEHITNCTEHRQLAAETARKAIVLLKNDDGLLPLDRTKIKTLAVIGPNADEVHLGGYSAHPQRDGDTLGISVLEGIRMKAGNEIQVLHAIGCKITEPPHYWEDWWKEDLPPADPELDAARIAEATEVARQADVALLVLGENEFTCREGWSNTHLGDRDSLDLPGRQNELVTAVAETGVPIVVLLINGRPLSINFIAEHIPAILEGWYLGQETGIAVADILFGDANPGGKLPITFPRSVGQIPAYYYHKPSARRGYVFAEKEPIFPFGHGLSYTTFRYDNLRVTPQKMRPGESALVQVELTNTGNLAGDEVVQLYIHDQASRVVTRPVKLLKGFQRTMLQPGETQTISFMLASDQLAYLDENIKWTVEPGIFDILVGCSSVQTNTIQMEVQRE